MIVVSDEVSSGSDADRAGPVAVELLATHGVQAERTVVADQSEAVVGAVQAAVAGGARFVMTCGGTGIGPTDVTVDAIAPLLSYQIPGIPEEIRRRGAERVPSALISREIAGVILGSPSVLVLAAPGSRGGVRDAVGVVGPLLPHIVTQLDGAGHI